MIFGIESSCDESAVACFDPRSGIVFERVASQVALHAVYGGVVPDLASREHLDGFDLVFRALRAQVDVGALSGVAVTRGPGLAACLALGIVAAQAISEALAIPLYGVNHLHGHAYSPFIPIHARNPDGFLDALPSLLPHLGLIVSGGNTLLVAIGEDLGIRLLAGTVDDAAGEAIDKGPN
jgi:N6-L-threonylcarbamoyladenine synthase